MGSRKASKRLKRGFSDVYRTACFQVYLDESSAKAQVDVADEYLIHCGVKDGIKRPEFKNSSFLSDDQYRMIDLVVEYDIEVYFFKLFRKDPTIHVVQRCEVPAWLNGDGVKYSK